MIKGLLRNKVFRIDEVISFFFKAQVAANSRASISKTCNAEKGRKNKSKCIGYFVTNPKVLFVCLGNICRSAMAQGILEQKVKELNLNIIVDSAGTCNHHVGQQPDQRMQKKGLEHNIDISNQRARQFEVSDFNRFDYIFAMDKINLSDMLQLAKNETHTLKIKLFLDYTYPNQQKSVPDPYFGGEEGFEEVYQLLNEACNAFIKSIQHD